MKKQIKDLKIGVIGCGKHSSVNIYPSLKILGAEIRSICTRHIDTAREAVSKFNAKVAYDNYKEMLEKEDLDIVFVITSGDQHFRIVSDCLKAGKHVFVEKPLGWNKEEAIKIERLSKKVRKMVMVAFMKRFAPSYSKVKELIKNKGNFGNIISLHGMFAVRNFNSDIDAYIKYAGIHYIDLIRYLLGDIVKVNSFKNVSRYGVCLVINFLSKTGEIGTVYFAGLPSWSRHFEEITVTGTDGFVKVENMTKLIYKMKSKEENTVPSWQILNEKTEVLAPVETSSSGGLQPLYLNGYLYEVEHFLNCVLKNKEPLTSAAENVKTTMLCDMILKSL